MRLLALLLLSSAMLTLGACSSPGTGPYEGADPARRDTSKADQLNRDAAELMASEPDKAEKLLREALTADLYHGPAHNNLGVLFLKQQKLYEAAGEFEWARKLLPGHPDPRLNLSLTLESAGRYEQAMDHVRTALQIHPGHIASIQQLARLELLHPPPTHTKASLSSSRDPSARAELRGHLEEIAMRGESAAWKDWARLQLVKMDGGR